MGATLAALSGVNNVAGPGMLDYVNTFSLEKLLVDNEICGMAQRLIQGEEPKQDFPAHTLVEQLLSDKHLIIADHTLKHAKSERFLPGAIIDRTNRARWKEQGEPDLRNRTKEHLERLLSNYQPIGLDSAIYQELEDLMLAEARQNQLDKLPQHS